MFDIRLNPFDNQKRFIAHPYLLVYALRRQVTQTYKHRFKKLSLLLPFIL